MGFVENDWVRVSDPETLAARKYSDRTGYVKSVNHEHPYPYLVGFDPGFEVGDRLAFAEGELTLAALDGPCQQCPRSQSAACCTEEPALDDSEGDAPLDVSHFTNGPEVDDPVNHPSHYTSYDGVEVIQLTEQMNFNRGNAIKYIARAGLKSPESELQDLEKAAWCVEREKRRVQEVQA